MLSDPELHYHLARRRQREAQARAKRAHDLRAAGAVSGLRAASAAVLRWLADRVDATPGSLGEGCYRSNA